MLLSAMMASGMMGFENHPVEGGGGGSGSPPAVAPAPQAPPPPPAPPAAAPQADPAQAAAAEWTKKLQTEQGARMKAEQELQAMRAQNLTAEQKLQAELAELRQNQAAQAQMIEAERRQREVDAHWASLNAYRSDLLLKWGDRLPAFLHPRVVGNTPQEIYNAALSAHTEYTEHMARSGMQAPLSAPQVQSPYVPAPGVQGGGYPTPIQGMGPPPPPKGVDTRALTSEQAIRSGKYAEVRDALLDALRAGQDPSQALATYNQQQSQQPPSGARPAIQYKDVAGQQVPIAAPMAQPIPAHLRPQYQGQQQVPQQAPPPPPVQQQMQQVPPAHFQPPAPPAPGTQGAGGGVDYRAEAQAAAERTRQGLNPLVSQTPGAQSQLSMIQSSPHAQVNPLTAFQQRFQQGGS